MRNTTISVKTASTLHGLQYFVVSQNYIMFWTFIEDLVSAKEYFPAEPAGLSHSLQLIRRK